MAYRWVSGIPTTRCSGVHTLRSESRRINWKDSPKFRWGDLEETRGGDRVHVDSFLFAQADAEQGDGVDEDEPGSHDDDRLYREWTDHVDE